MFTVLRPFAICILLLAAGFADRGLAQSGQINDAGTAELILKPIRTDSPRDTLTSLLRIRDELSAAIPQYRQDKTKGKREQLLLLSDQARALIDLSAVPNASRQERGDETVMALLDLFGRIAPPASDDVPDVEAVADLEGTVVWRVPQTPIRIGLIQDGPREGEFLFTAQSVRAAQRFLRGIEELPLKERVPFESWTDMNRQITGPLIPTALLQVVPEGLQDLWMDTPAWKVLMVILAYALLILALAGLFRLLRKVETEGRLNWLLLRMTIAIAALIAILLLLPVFAEDVNLSGRATDVQNFAQTVAVYLAWAWIFWLTIRAAFEWLISSTPISEEGFDANMLRLISGLTGIIGVILILAYCGQELGLPVMSLLAGLGIGGLAVALAIRPTLENLIGGFILYIDKPVRVGDFCTFGGQSGTIENIGIRSTQIRGTDRTLIAVPNAQFADMQLTNWANCDQMLIAEMIGVRYETTPDQLRFLLANIREMLHRHPRIDRNTVRVRFAGYGDSALNISLRIYAMTREWNDFHAIREDIFLRIYDIVTDAGTGFAFPSQTVYLGNDSGLDEAARDAAAKRVQSWRKAGKLPFPRFPEDHQERLEATLDYPPRGSFEADGEDLSAAAGSETLSAEPIDETHEHEEDIEKKPAV